MSPRKGGPRAAGRKKIPAKRPAKGPGKNQAKGPAKGRAKAVGKILVKSPVKSPAKSPVKSPAKGAAIQAPVPGRPGGGRGLTIKVKSARGRKLSSTRWLQRQLNDPYVAAARADGYRSRAAYKLIEMDNKLEILTRGAKILDLGAAPGGWTQVAVDRVKLKNGSNKGGNDEGVVVAIDLQEIDPPICGAVIFHEDATTDEALVRMRDALGGAADVVLSDMSPLVTGHSSTDHIRIMGLCESACDIASRLLRPGGSFVAKVFQGGADGEMLKMLKKDFSRVRHMKPPASRKESPEMYVIATGYRGESRQD